MWRKFKPGRRYKTKLFDREYLKHGEELRDSLLHEVLSKKKLFAEEYRFLDHMGYAVSSTPMKGWKSFNGYYYWSDPTRKWKPVLKTNEIENIQDFTLEQYLESSEKLTYDGLISPDDLMDFCEDNSVFFNNTASDICRQLFLPKPRRKDLILEFVSKEAEKDFLSELRVLRFETHLDYPTIAKELTTMTNISLSFSYIEHYLSDKA